MGMTYQEVINLLGRRPDTVYNAQILQELGEGPGEPSLISFEWRNDDPDCYPVGVDFNVSSMRVTGWDQGLICLDGGLLNEPLGIPCAETTLCNPN